MSELVIIVSNTYIFIHSSPTKDNTHTFTGIPDIQKLVVWKRSFCLFISDHFDPNHQSFASNISYTFKTISQSRKLCQKVSSNNLGIFLNLFFFNHLKKSRKLCEIKNMYYHYSSLCCGLLTLICEHNNEYCVTLIIQSAWMHISDTFFSWFTPHS